MASSLPTALQRIATRWAQMLTTIAEEFAPKHIAPYIHSKTQKLDDGNFSITVGVDLNANPIEKYGTKDARAQELGSGLYGEYGSTDYIHILPKKGRFLAFYWEVANQPGSKFRKVAGQVMEENGNLSSYDRVVLPSVQSPGIHPYKGSGYLKPAVDELRAKGRADLDIDIRNAILSDLRVAFKHAKT